MLPVIDGPATSSDGATAVERRLLPDRFEEANTVTDDCAVSLRDLSVHFFKKNVRITAVNQVSLEVPHGSFVALLGPSGCGKSTLLNCIAGLQLPSIGEARAYGEPITGPNIGVGYMTQRDALLPWRNIEGNVRLPLDIKRSSKFFRRQRDETADDRVAAALEMVGLQSFKHHYPRELSGGMLKRAALAQTLVSSKDIILMDEPFGALDAQLKLQLHRELIRVWNEEKRTIVFVTHDIEEAVALCDSVVVLAARPGRIKAIVQIDLPRPRDPVDIRFDPKFRELHERIWNLIDLPEMTTAA
jgi:sulfonate transport system ATP-binding protein